MADDVTPRPKPKPAETRESMVFVDYLGAPDREGNRRPSHRLAPIVAGPSEDGKLPVIKIRPGLTVHEASTWSVHSSAPKESKTPKNGKAKPALDSIAKLVRDGHLVVLKKLPTNAAALLALAGRTQCPDALQLLVKHEEGRKGGRPRAAVLGTLKVLKAAADRRATSPTAPGDQRRLKAAKAKAARVLH